MFGVMNEFGPCKTSIHKERNRLHYCGTCKTIGRMYGQKERLLLSSDVAFLGEVLDIISEEEGSISTWDQNYRSGSCFKIPKNENLKSYLLFTSSINLFLTELKVNDKISDAEGFIWKVARFFLKKNFRKARHALEARNFPVIEMVELSSNQKHKELESLQLNFNSPDECITYLSDSTMKITGETFAVAIDLVNKNIDNSLYRKLGEQFGRLAYLLDACEDFESDYKMKQFNALRVAFQQENMKMLDCEKSQTIDLVLSNLKEIIKIIQCLDMPNEEIEGLCTRLEWSVKQKLLTPKSSAPLKRSNWAEAIRAAKEKIASIQQKGNDFGMFKQVFFSVILALALRLAPKIQHHPQYIFADSGLGIICCICICLAICGGSSKTAV